MAEAQDKIIYERADGRRITLKPADDRWPIVNREVEKILVKRPGSENLGEWVVDEPRDDTPAPTLPPGSPPLVVPPPVIPPPPPVVAFLPTVIAPEREDSRGNGVRNRSLSRTWVRGHSQNIVIDQAGSYTLESGLTTGAWRRLINGDPHRFEGQGLYVEGDNEVIVRNFYFGSNGWQRNREAWEKSMYRHGAYINQGRSIRFENCIFDDNCAQAMKLMRSSVVVNCFLYRNPVGISAIYGTHEWSEVTIYGGGYYFDGANWTANTGITTYTPVTMRDLWVVGMPDAELFVAPRQKPTGRFNMGAILGENWHQQYNDSQKKYPNVPGSRLTASNCVLAGWQGAKFAGKAAHDGSGFQQFANPVRVDCESLLKPIREGRVEVTAERVRELHKLVRSAVK